MSPVMLGLLLAATAVGCGGSDAKITDQPTDYDSGRSLAEAVAADAGCKYVESASLQSADHWTFSCDFDGSTFDIRTATSSQVRDAARPTRSPFVVGDFYLVVPLGPGSSEKVVPPPGPSTTDIERLKSFPGQYVPS